ncbi:amastin [Trypanosoma conorhini]|uniref:Amastin n=1 Tax=Trypanosoma conorhini TaxID=83891 RepID=A0A3R7KZI2_9TRYP|nr:amastin [Trypanosoma conorhini]RNF18151.1 amastin [Trypanosoma conorhini]
MAFEAIAGKLGASVYMLCACIAFVFVCVGTPTAQFRGRGYLHGADVSKLSCVSLWGMKNDCTKDTYDLRPGDFVCPDSASRLKQVFQAGEAFAIISIFVTLASIIAVGYHFFRSSSVVPTMILAVAGVVTILIPWACMAAVYNGKMCGSAFRTNWQKQWKYSAAFGLYVAGWCSQVLGTVCLMAL